MMLAKEAPLASVNDVFNGVLITGNMLGDVMFYGRGAGKLPTASAVVSDVIDCARHVGRTSIVCIWDKEEMQLADLSETEKGFFLRAALSVKDEIVNAFPGGKLVELEGAEEFGYFTTSMKEKEFDAKAIVLGDKIHNRIRVA